MNNQNLMPQPAQPVYRTIPGQLPPELAELSEETLSLGTDASTIGGGAFLWGGLNVADWEFGNCLYCSYGGDDAE